MNVAEVSSKQIARDSVKMTLAGLAMQTAGMIFNALLCSKAGTSAVGLMSLIFSLFGFIMVLANGNILTSASRFISEARGAGHRNYSKLMRYCLTFSLCLSTGFGCISFLLAGVIGKHFSGAEELVLAVRLISLSLPFASAGSCIKGFFNGIRRVDIPLRGDITEFAAKWLSLFTGLLLFGGTDLFYVVTAASILMGEVLSFIYYGYKYRKAYIDFHGLPLCDAPLLTDTPKGFLKSTLPILLGGYVQMLMSTANELLVPTALLAYSKNTEEALSEYGCFEAMIMPALFFPSSVLTGLSGIIIPESALANRCEDKKIRACRLGVLADGAFRKCFSFSIFVAAVYLYCGKALGTLICPTDELVGSSLVILAPVIPFIYLEIILEGLLKGMGRQNFSTVNSLAEYAVRIACVILLVGKIGFGGVLVSYYASNIISNIARMIVACKEARLHFDVCAYIVKPVIRAFLCCEGARLLTLLTHADHSGESVRLILFILAAVSLFALTVQRKGLHSKQCG